MRARRQLVEIETIEHGSNLQSVKLGRVWESRSTRLSVQSCQQRSEPRIMFMAWVQFTEPLKEVQFTSLIYMCDGLRLKSGYVRVARTRGLGPGCHAKSVDIHHQHPNINPQRRAGNPSPPDNMEHTNAPSP